MKRIIIIGCAGAGKSTLARQLGQKLNLPVVHLDKIFWKPGWVEMEKDQFDAAIRTEMEKEQWIIDGNYSRTLAERIRQSDTVIYLDFRRMTCLWGAIKRNLTNRGKVRPDMGEGCPEKIDMVFLKWIWHYNRNKREHNYRLLNEATHAQTIVLKNHRMVKRFLDSL